MQDGVAEHEIEAPILERQALGVGGLRPDAQPEPAGGGAEFGEHPGRDIGGHQPLDHAELHEG